MDLYDFLRPFASTIFKILFHLEVKGKQFLPKKGGFILASNHASNLDPVVLGVATPKRLSFMAKEELFLNPLFGFIIHILGAFPVKRGSPDLSAIKEAIRRLEREDCLVIFPQGRRSSENLEASAGVGFLAIKTKVPVIPVYIKGTDKILPKGKKTVSIGKIKVKFGNPIILKEKGGKSYQDIAEQIMVDIGRLACV